MKIKYGIQLDTDLLDFIKKLAAEEHRSLNGQLCYMLYLSAEQWKRDHPGQPEE